MVRTKKNEEKTEVEKNQIVESDIEPRYFLTNWFIELKAEDVKVKDTQKKVSTKK